MVENIKFYYYGAKYGKRFESHDILAWNAGEKKFWKKNSEIVFRVPKYDVVLYGVVWEREKIIILKYYRGGEGS